MTRLHWNCCRTRWWTEPSTFACIVAIAGCVHALWWREDILTRREHLLEHAKEADRLTSTREHRAAATRPPPLAHVFEEMRYPWDDVLESLHRATKPGIDLTELEPDAGDVRRVHIQGMADTTESVFDMLAALDDDPSWSSAQLVSQTKADEGLVQRNDTSMNPPLPSLPSRSVVFSLVAQWKQP